VEAKEATNVLDKREKFNIRKPTVSKKNDMIVFVFKNIIAKRNAIFNKSHRISIRIMFAFEATKPDRDTLLTNTKREE